MRSCEVREHRSLATGAEPINPEDRTDLFSFYDSAWIQAWDKAFLPSPSWARPVVAYSVASGGSCIGFIAFADQKISGLRIKSMAGYYWPFRTLAVSGDEGARIAFAQALADHFDKRSPGVVLRFGPVRTDDRTVFELLEELGARGWHMIQRKEGRVFEFDLPRDPGQLEAGLSGSLLKNVKYQRRRLAKLADTVSCERYVLGDNAVELVDVLARVEAASWVAKEGGQVKFIGQSNQRFWEAVGRAHKRNWEPVVWIMRCGRSPIAFSAHIETNDCIHIIANSYDEEWASFSPGSILSHAILTDCCQRGRTHIDWGTGDSASGYKSRWGAKCDAAGLLEVMIFRPGLIGKLLAHAAGYFFHRKQRATSATISSPMATYLDVLQEKRGKLAAAYWLLREILCIDAYYFYAIDPALFTRDRELDLPEGYTLFELKDAEQLPGCSPDILQQIEQESGKRVSQIVAEGGRVYAVVHGREVVSQVKINFLPFEVDTPLRMVLDLGQKAAFLSFLYTAPSYRRKRWATRIIAQVCAVLTREETPCCLCHVQATNVASHNTFRSCGWKPVVYLFATTGGRLLGMTRPAHAARWARLRVRAVSERSGLGPLPPRP